MTDETKIRVRLDTTQATSEMASLERRGQKAAGRLSERLRGTVGQAFGAAGVGGIAGAVTSSATNAVRGSASGGFTDILGETFGSTGAAFNEFLFGKIDDASRASRSAREETIQAFGQIAGIQGSVPTEAKTFYDQIQRINLQKESGRSAIESDSRFYAENERLMGSLIDRIGSKIGEELRSVFSDLVFGPPAPR